MLACCLPPRLPLPLTPIPPSFRPLPPTPQVGHSAMLAAAASGAPTGGRIPKPDIVLTTYEAVSSDLHALRALPWSAVVLDLRQRSRSAAGKAHAALQELTAGSGAQRLVLTPHRQRGRGADEVFNLVSLVRPAGWVAAGEAMPDGLEDPEAQVGAGGLGGGGVREGGGFEEGGHMGCVGGWVLGLACACC